MISDEEFIKCTAEISDILSKYFNNKPSKDILEFLMVLHISTFISILKKDLTERELEEALVSLSREMYLKSKEFYFSEINQTKSFE